MSEEIEEPKEEKKPDRVPSFLFRAGMVLWAIVIIGGNYDLHLRSREALLEHKIHRLLLVVEDQERSNACLRFELLAAGTPIEFQRGRSLAQIQKRSEELLEKCLPGKTPSLEDYVLQEDGWSWERGFWGGKPEARKGNLLPTWPMENSP